MRRSTIKQKFLTLLKRSKDYVGNKKITCALYKKYLKIVAASGKCGRKDLFGPNGVRSTTYYIVRGHTYEYACAAVHKIQSRGVGFYNGSVDKIKQRVEKRALTFASKDQHIIKAINELKGKSYDPSYIASKHNITIEEAIDRIADRKRRKVESFKKFMRNRDPNDTASRPFVGYSKASKKFFDKLVNLCAEFKLTFYYGDREYFLYCENTKTVKYYDLYIPEINLFVEYNGTHFHPRVNDNSFITVAQSIANDEFKFNLAAARGIDVEYVWEGRSENDRLIELIDCIKVRMTQNRSIIDLKKS